MFALLSPEWAGGARSSAFLMALLVTLPAGVVAQGGSRATAIAVVRAEVVESLPAPDVALFTMAPDDAERPGPRDAAPSDAGTVGLAIRVAKDAHVVVSGSCPVDFRRDVPGGGRVALALASLCLRSSPTTVTIRLEG
ncbi:MAG: hypothetical protein ABFS34_15840 [Gemmatimonadota bacterium]